MFLISNLLSSGSAHAGNSTSNKITRKLQWSVTKIASTRTFGIIVSGRFTKNWRIRCISCNAEFLGCMISLWFVCLYWRSLTVSGDWETVWIFPCKLVIDCTMYHQWPNERTNVNDPLPRVFRLRFRRFLDSRFLRNGTNERFGIGLYGIPVGAEILASAVP